MMRIHSKILLFLFLATSFSCERMDCEYYIKKFRNEIQSELSQCSKVGDCIVVGANCPLGCFYAINKIHEKRIEEMNRKLWEACPPCVTECVFPYPKETICIDGKCQAKLSK